MVREQRHANASDGAYSYGARYNVSYLELLASSRLFLTVTGDAWTGGNIWQARGPLFVFTCPSVQMYVIRFCLFCFVLFVYTTHHTIALFPLGSQW